MKKIAIIGANSYIARNLIIELKKYKYQVLLYDRAETHIDGEKNYTSIDVLSKDSIKKIDLNCNIVYLFIGKTGTLNGFDDYETYVNINEISLLNVLNEYREQKSTAKIIFPSTRLVYKGKTGKVNENSEKEFKTIYSINKYACEKYLEQFHNIFGVNYCIFRICVPYGTMIKNASSLGTAEFMLSKARKGENITLYGNGNMRRTITHMKDLCTVLIKGALNNGCTNDIFNIGGEDYSLKEMAELIAAKYDVNVDYIEWPLLAKKIESGNTVFDDSKIQNILGKITTHKFSDWILNEQ